MSQKSYLVWFLIVCSCVSECRILHNVQIGIKDSAKSILVEMIQNWHMLCRSKVKLSHLVKLSALFTGARLGLNRDTCRCSLVPRESIQKCAFSLNKISMSCALRCGKILILECVAIDGLDFAGRGGAVNVWSDCSLFKLLKKLTLHSILAGNKIKFKHKILYKKLQ